MPKVFASKMQIHRVINTTKANCVQLHVGLQGSRKAQRCVKSKGSCLRLEALKYLKIIQILLFSVKHPGTSLDINQSVCYIATRLSHTWEDRLQRGRQCLLPSAWSEIQGLQHDDRWFRWPMKMYHCYPLLTQDVSWRLRFSDQSDSAAFGCETGNLRISVRWLATD